MKVIYLAIIPLIEKTEQDWFISHLISNGICAEYWDLSELFFSRSDVVGRIQRDYAVHINTHADFNSRVAASSADAVFIPLFNVEGRFFRIFRTLTRYDRQMHFFEWGNFPVPATRRGFLLKNLLSPKGALQKIGDRIVRDIFPGLGVIKPFDVVYAAGHASMRMHRNARKIVPINFFDYEKYLEKKYAAPLINGKYAVFLDVFLPYHPDIRLVGRKYINAERYFAAMRKYFDLVERQAGVEVVIAAHPKSEYASDAFGGRRIIKSETAVIVRDSEFVISHHSTSMSYAVLNMKPILFVYTADMEAEYGDFYVAWIKSFARYLNSVAWKADDLTDPSKLTIREPDQVRYQLYRDEYLADSTTLHLRTSDIFLDNIRSAKSP